MKDSIAVIGSGVIGGAIIQSLLKSKYDGKITAADIQSERIEKLKKRARWFRLISVYPNYRQNTNAY